MFLGSTIACLPLMTDGQVHAALALTFTEGRQLDSDDRTFLILLANEAASALDRAWRRDAERRERERLAFLAAAGEALSASLDSQETLATVARLAVEHGLADWCTVEIVDEQTSARQQLAVAHRDPAKVAMADELRQRFPPDPDGTGGVAAVLRTGRAELYPTITPELIAASVSDPVFVDLLRQLGLSSVMIVPMAVGASRDWRLRSWDEFRIPKPFARCVMRFGEPIRVPADADRAAQEAARKEVEAALRGVTWQADEEARG